EAADARLIAPILVGPEAEIRRLATAHALDLGRCRLLDRPDPPSSAETAVALARAGEGRALMKGSLHTDALMATGIDGTTGIRAARRMSHVFVMDVPTYPKPLFLTDAAINILPTLDEKADILRNAIDLAHALGVAKPKIAVLSAVESVNSKIPSTIDAAALCKMADRGQIEGAVIDGPLALDNAI